jgi:hypothetical protein
MKLLSSSLYGYQNKVVRFDVCVDNFGIHQSLRHSQDLAREESLGCLAEILVQVDGVEQSHLGLEGHLQDGAVVVHDHARDFTEVLHLLKID